MLKSEVRIKWRLKIQMNVAMVYHGFRTTQHIQNETIARILQSYNVCIAYKPITTPWRLLTNVIDKDEPKNRQRIVYKIKCYDCQAAYISETGINRNARITEHKQATKDGDLNNNIAEHHSPTKHVTDWDSAKCLTYCTNYYYYQRHTLESWNTNLEQTTLNRFWRNCDAQ